MIQAMEGEVLGTCNNGFLSRKERRELYRQQERDAKHAKRRKHWHNKSLCKPNRNARKDRRQNRHHLLNKCRGGSMMSENLVWLDIEKHNLLHKIFRNDDPEYIIMAIDRLMDMKGYHRFRGVRVWRDPIAQQVAA